MLTGCNQKDSEHLNKISQKTAHYVEASMGGPNTKLMNGYQAVLGSLGDAMVDSRVSTRLIWEKTMGDSKIEVNLISPGVVKLTGKVKEESQKQKAMELAQATLGVTKVINEVVITEKPKEDPGKEQKPKEEVKKDPIQEEPKKEPAQAEPKKEEKPGS